MQYLGHCYGQKYLEPSSLLLPSTERRLYTAVVTLRSSADQMPSQIIQLFFKILFIYLREKEHTSGRRDRGKGWNRLPICWAGIQIWGSRDLGIWGSWDPRIMTWAEGSCLTNWATQVPQDYITLYSSHCCGIVEPNGQERSLETLYGAKKLFYYSAGTGPTARKSNTEMVSSDWLHIF